MVDPGDILPSYIDRGRSGADFGRANGTPRAGRAAPGAVTVDITRATVPASKDLKTASLSLDGAGDVEGLDIAFDRLSFTVPGRRGSSGVQILREACGFASAGRLTAMQGPSGAGKVSGLGGLGWRARAGLDARPRPPMWGARSPSGARGAGRGGRRLGGRAPHAARARHRGQ